MNIFKYLISATDNRISRFHSERGELMPVADFLRLPLTVFERLSGRYKKTPWLVPSAVLWLAKNISPDWKILELGCGYSTLWYAAKCDFIEGLEDDPEWFNIVSEEIRSSSIQNCTIILMADISEQSLTGYQNDYFDLVIVDCHDKRLACAAAAALKVKSGGYLIIDDTDLPHLQNVDFLRDWQKKCFVGIKPYPLVCTETSLFQRPVV